MTDKQKPNWQPSGLIQKAFALAAEQHKDKVRKGSGVPYLSHLMAVSALVTEHGGTEVQAAAALLHDLIEDTDLKDEFLISARSREVVRACLSRCCKQCD